MFLKGDLNQMYIQKRFLIKKGFQLNQEDVYPIVKNEDKKKVLNLLYLYTIEGWWNYQDELINSKICTKGEYLNKLKK